MASHPAPGPYGIVPSRSTSQARRPLEPAPALPPVDCIDVTLDEARLPPPTAPPRGRPPLFYTTGSSSHQLTTNLPIPPRPGSLRPGDASQQPRILPGGPGFKNPPKPGVPHSIPVPARVPRDKTSDICTWLDNTEDSLSEALVKAGITNKSQIMNETSTARTSLGPNLKNKAGVPSLSTLLVAAMEKRQHTGRLQAPHSFKPPPRLTLRDSTREAWLHDLSNLSVNLKRLSRTIPHGLTGKMLLDQCMNKKIPLPRAMWLARCVGSNELRAHQRKGHAGTVTWSRGWTSSVEQFLEGVISSLGQEDWRPRMAYAMAMVTNLYTERLLDDDHFVDWMLDGFDTCSSDSVRAWLLVVAVPPYWDDILSYRHRGKRLVESLLGHFAKLSPLEESSPVHEMGLQPLKNCLLKLLADRSACLLLPASWSEHRDTFKYLAAKHGDGQITQDVDKLDNRNSRLTQCRQNDRPLFQSIAARVFCELDAVDYTSLINVDHLSAKCIKITSNPAQLISALLEWACSFYRTGSHRIYLATRLLRLWGRLGADVTTCILTFLHRMTWSKTGDVKILLRIVAELVRSQDFSVGFYLRWLIATGAWHDTTSLDLPRSWPMRLVIEIPLTGLSDEVCTLRSRYLRGTTHSTDSEQQTLADIKRTIIEALPALFGLDSTVPCYAELSLGGLRPSIRLELAVWLRQQIAQRVAMNEHVPNVDGSGEGTEPVSLISLGDYHTVRSILEQCEDLAILADVIQITASSLDMIVLASVADTLHYHRKAFHAIGAFTQLIRQVAMRYAAIRTVRFPEPELLLSLQHVARTVAPDGQLQRLLSYDLNRLDQNNSDAAYSPASDNMGEEMQCASTYSDDEIERVLSSGTNMDQQMMSRVLRKIVSNLEEHVRNGYRHSGNHLTWFRRLRNFDETTFDAIVHEWLESCLMARQSQTLQIAVPALVTSTCMSLSTVLDVLRNTITSIQVPQVVPATIAMDVLTLILPSELPFTSCSLRDGYRYRTEQYNLCLTSGSRVVSCICEVAEYALSSPSMTMPHAVFKLLTSQHVMDIVKQHIASDPNFLSKLKTMYSSQDLLTKCFGHLLHDLFDPSGRYRLTKVSPKEQVIAVFRASSDLSRPICQAVLEHIFSLSCELDANAADVLSMALLKAFETSVGDHHAQGLALLATLESPLADKIRHHAEREVLDASHWLVQGSSNDLSNNNKITTAVLHKYITVINLTVRETSHAFHESVMLPALIDRFKGISHELSGLDGTEVFREQAPHTPVAALYEWLKALLRLLALHGPKLLSDATPAHQVALMLSLQVIITHSALRLYPSVVDHVFEVAATLSDLVSDNVRNELPRCNSAESSRPDLLRFINGRQASMDDWVMVTKPVHPPLESSIPQPSTSNTTPSHTSPYQSPPTNPTSSTPQHRAPYHQQQRQQSQQAQQMRMYPQLNPQAVRTDRRISTPLQRAQSLHGSPSPIQQMQYMQQLQGQAQQRASQPSPAHSQRPSPAAGSSSIGGASGGNASPHTTQPPHASQQREMRRFPFVQPRWESLPENSGNPTLNETPINMTLFGARRV